MNQKRTIVRVGAGLVLLLVLAGGTVVGLACWHEQNLPVYIMGQRPPERNIGVNTLTWGPVIYIAGPDEFPRLNRIGQTTGGGLETYRPDGQTGEDYIFVGGDMVADMVYRNSRIPPVSLATLPISEIRLARSTGGSRSSKTTRDIQVIREAVDALIDPNAKQVTFPPGDATGGIGYILMLSDRLPGLGYYAEVRPDEGGRIYLRATGPDDTWLSAGESFSRWARQ